MESFSFNFSKSRVTLPGALGPWGPGPTWLYSVALSHVLRPQEPQETTPCMPSSPRAVSQWKLSGPCCLEGCVGQRPALCIGQVTQPEDPGSSPRPGSALCLDPPASVCLSVSQGSPGRACLGARCTTEPEEGWGLTLSLWGAGWISGRQARPDRVEVEGRSTGQSGNPGLGAGLGGHHAC